jgi:ferredoxin
MSETITIKIERYNKELDEDIHIKEYEVPSNTTLLKAFEYIKTKIDASFSFSSSCRSEICGSCAVRVNSREELSCKYRPKDGDEVSALRNCEILKDLIVDTKENFKKIKLANAYGITKLTLDPNDINDKFFEQDFSKIEFINLMSDTVDEDVANKLFELSSKTNINIAFAYDTTVGNLEQKMLKEAANPEELKEYPDDVWNGINWEDKELDLTVVSYNDFDSYYDTNEDILKAIYNNAFSLKASGEKVIVMESDDYDFKVMSLDCTDHLGQEQWEYYSTDTNDGVLERYINYCSAELTDIGIEDILSFKLGNISAEELVDDYGLDYDCEQEGYYGD